MHGNVSVHAPCARWQSCSMTKAHTSTALICVCCAPRSRAMLYGRTVARRATRLRRRKIVQLLPLGLHSDSLQKVCSAAFAAVTRTHPQRTHTRLAQHGNLRTDLPRAPCRFDGPHLPPAAAQSAAVDSAAAADVSTTTRMRHHHTSGRIQRDGQLDRAARSGSAARATCGKQSPVDVWLTMMPTSAAGRRCAPSPVSINSEKKRCQPVNSEGPCGGGVRWRCSGR